MEFLRYRHHLSATLPLACCTTGQRSGGSHGCKWRREPVEHLVERLTLERDVAKKPRTDGTRGDLQMSC